MIVFIVLGVGVGGLAWFVFRAPRGLRILTALFIGTLGGMVGGVAANVLTFRLLFEFNVVSAAGAILGAAALVVFAARASDGRS